MLILLVMEIAIGIGAIAVLALFPLRSHWPLALQICTTALLILVLTLTGIWTIWWLPLALWLGFLIALVSALFVRRPYRGTGSTRTAIVAAICYGVVGLAAGYYAIVAWAGRTMPDEQIVDLAFPLRGDNYYVLNGGFSENISAHMLTLARETPGQRAFYGQSYAVDIVALGRWGFTSSGFLPSKPERYAIFGDAIVAPCPGEVIARRDGLPDMPVPVADREHMTGNYVMLRCEAADVLLAHMTPGSVRVAVGDHVRVGTHLGNVGNSGNTNMPHLHIHAQRPGSVAEPFSGDPLPARFDGRFLFRGDRL